MNTNAIHLLEQNQDKIDWDWLSENPSIFTYDYEQIRQVNSLKNRCISQWFSHPRFIEKFLQDHDTEELDSYNDYILNRYVV